MTSPTLIRYTTGVDPHETGTYAVRIDEGGMLHDCFAQWFEGQWWHPLSDQKFRKDVLGWVGPLQRTLVPFLKRRDEHGKFTTTNDTDENP